MKIRNVFTFNYVISFLYVLALFFLYPSLLGAKFASVGFGVTLLLLTIIIVLSKEFIVNRELFISLSAFLFFYFVPGVLNENTNQISLLGGFSFISTFSLATLLILSKRELLDKINKIILTILCLHAVSCAVTFILVLSGIGIDSLLIVDFMPNERAPGNVYFPFSLGGTYFTTLNLKFIRFSGFFREPGVSQIIYVFYIAYAIIFVNKWKSLTIILLTLGMLTTMSTTFLITFIIMVTFYLLFVTNNSALRILCLCVLPLSLLILMKVPFFGVEAKLETHTDAISDRVAGFEFLLLELNNSFFLGTGMYSEGEVKNSSISFILSLRENGIFGLICFGLLYLMPVIFFKPTRRYLFLMLSSAMIVTFLFAQPIFYSALNVFVFSNAFLLSQCHVRLKK